MVKMTFLAIDGCLLSSITNLIDAFGIADRWRRALDETAGSPLFETEIVSVDGDPVRADGNICIQPDRCMPEACNADMLFIPAFSDMSYIKAPPVARIQEWIVAQHRRGVPIATTCTGTFLLAEAGLLDGRVATTNWQYARMFQRNYPAVRLKIEQMITEADNLICTGAATAIFNLAIHLIRRYGGEPLAAICAKAVLVEPNRGSQAPYAIFRSTDNHGDKQVSAAQQWMAENYGQPISIDTVAHQVGISPRHFKRRFRKATGASPLVYLQKVRIQAAKEKLETTRESVNEITYRIGYEDSSTFRRLFKREVGVSPREYRDKFSRPAAAVRK